MYCDFAMDKKEAISSLTEQYEYVHLFSRKKFCNQQAESPACSVCFHYISFAGKGRNFAVLKYSEILFKNT